MWCVSWIPEIKRKALLRFPNHTCSLFSDLNSPQWTDKIPHQTQRISPLISLSHSAVCESWFPSSSVCVVDYEASSSSRQHQSQNRLSHVCRPELMPVDLFSNRFSRLVQHSNQWSCSVLLLWLHDVWYSTYIIKLNQIKCVCGPFTEWHDRTDNKSFILVESSNGRVGPLTKTE